MDIDIASDVVDQKILVNRLIAGKATQGERDRALATVMLSLWGQDDLRKLIRIVHGEECAKCSFRASAQDRANADYGWRDVSMMLLKYMGWIILIIAGIYKVSVT